MKTTPVVEITDVQSIGGTHMCGDATFADGKKYRFVIQNGLVQYLYIYNEDGKDYHRTNWASRSKMRAQMIADHAHGFLPQALADLQERQEKEEAKRRAEGEAWQKEKNLQDAAPDLLKQLKHLVGIICSLPGFEERDVTLEDCDEAKAAIAKAEGK